MTSLITTDLVRLDVDLGSDKTEVIRALAGVVAQADRAVDVDAIVASLEANGAAFEHYPDIGRLDGDVHVVGPARLVWFKDPDGNILHLNSM